MAGVIGSGRAPGHQAGYISGSSSDGSISGSEGGAPLGLSSPENYGPRIEAGTSIPKNNSPASSEASQTGDEYRTSQSGNSRNGDAWPRRSFAEKSATRSAAVSIPKTSSIGGPSPALTLAAYPGPGAAKERQPSLPALLPAPSVRGGVQVPGAVPKTSGRGVIPGATTQTFISAMQAVTFNPTDEGICPAHKVSGPVLHLITIFLIMLTCSRPCVTKSASCRPASGVSVRACTASQRFPRSS